MAKNTPEKQTPEVLKKEVDIVFTKPEPTFFKVGRDAMLQLSKVERDLFTDLEEAESGNYIISGLPKVTELDFTAFNFALAQILWNQSYKSGNQDVNSGISRVIAKNHKQELGEELYRGEIEVSRKELCRLAYGVQEPTTEMEKKIENLIETLHHTPVKIKFPNGNTIESWLCTMGSRYYRKKDNALFYNLRINPIYGSRIQTQFGELPQDVIVKLEKSCKKKKQRKQASHYILLRWLSVQDKRFPHTLTIDILIQELRMEEYFKKDKGKAEKQILSICDTMVDIGILSRYEVADRNTGKGKRIEKITFHLNPSYIRTKKEAIETQDGVETTGGSKGK